MATLSVRGFLGLALAGLVLATLIVIGVLVGITTSLLDATVRVAEDTASMRVADELEVQLYAHQRVANQRLATPNDDPLDQRLRAIEDRIESLLEQAKHHVGTSAERQALAEADEAVRAYLAGRQALEERDLPVEEVIGRSRPWFERAVGQVEAVRELNAIAVEDSLARAAEMNRSATVFAVLLSVAMTLGVIGLVLAFRRHLDRPLATIAAAIGRFRAGEAVRVPEDHLAELRRIAVNFNQMSAALLRRRQDQLTFVAGVAHDLRNPLNALKLGLAAIAADQGLAPRSREVLTRLDRQIDRLAGQLADLLDATRVEAGELALERTPHDLRDVVRDAVDMAAPTSREHELTFVAPDGPVLVDGDPVRLSQVVGNLLSNAIKYSPGGGRVIASLRRERDEAVLEVTDFGVGIPPDQLETIFAPFQRGADAGRVAPGAGLGLSVVRRIVAAHGGRIEVDSLPGAGTTFRVRLPALPQPLRRRPGSDGA